jgi:hypothetical protein
MTQTGFEQMIPVFKQSETVHTLDCEWHVTECYLSYLSYILTAQNSSQFVIFPFSSSWVLEPDLSITLYSWENLNPIQACGKFPYMRNKSIIRLLLQDTTQKNTNKHAYYEWDPTPWLQQSSSLQGHKDEDEDDHHHHELISKSLRSINSETHSTQFDILTTISYRRFQIFHLNYKANLLHFTSI